MKPQVQIEDLGDRLVVTNSNPAVRNALSPELYAGLRDAMKLAAENPRIAAVIVTGADGFFCAGGDLNLLISAQGMTREQIVAAIEDLHDLIRAVMACPRPVIAAVEGGAAGAGASLALACDMIVAARDAKFTAAYVNAGLVPDGGLTAHLIGAVPPALVAQMVLTGLPVGAERMYAVGAINEITEPGGALGAAHAIADRLAQGPAETQAAIKALVSAARNDWTLAQLDRERDAMAQALAAPEAAEGIRSFLEKRKPAFGKMRAGG